MMTLIYSTTSPFARKVLITAMELGLRDQITLEIAHPLRNAEQVSDANPLGKVPCLLTDAGQMVVNSPVICQFLQRMAPAGPELHDPSYMDIDTVEREQALADGLIDLTIGRRIEMQRDADKQWDFWSERWERGIRRTLDALYADRGQYERSVDLGALSVAIALYYLDLRYPELDWRGQYPELGEFAARWDQRASFEQTRPPQ